MTRCNSDTAEDDQFIAGFLATNTVLVLVNVYK